MSRVMLELRTAVMTLVHASWEEPNGVLQSVKACMEDKSASGACIRLQTPIRVGSRVRIEWRFEKFSGTTKYCRSEGREYLVGIQRDAAKNPIHDTLVPKNVPPQKSVTSSRSSASTVESQSVPKRQEGKACEISVSEPKPEGAITAQTATFAAALPRNKMSFEADATEWLGISRPQEFRTPRWPEPPTENPPKRKESGKERKLVGNKWLDLAPWHGKKESIAAVGGGHGEAGRDGDENSKPKIEKENRMLNLNQSTEKTPPHSAREVPNFQVELLPVEDIYRAAGIMNPRRGYSINKVVEMLENEHIRGSSKEMKQAAVLMALDAAGIQMDQVRQDAKVRQEALDSYEAVQKKLAEEVWARKAEEVIQIQAELESVKAHHLARISRSLEGVAREKATFNTWLTLKQQECQSMAEAVEMCVKSPVSAPANTPSPEASKEKVATAAGGSTKPM